MMTMPPMPTAPGMEEEEDPQAALADLFGSGDGGGGAPPDMSGDMGGLDMSMLEGLGEEDDMGMSEEGAFDPAAGGMQMADMSSAQPLDDLFADEETEPPPFGTSPPTQGPPPAPRMRTSLQGGRGGGMPPSRFLQF